MPTPAPETENRSSRDLAIAHPFRNVFLPLLPVLACFLGGATQKWAEGIILALFGLYLLVSPPRASLGLTVNSALILFLALAAVAFLPAQWFSWPAWRSALIDDFQINLPSTLSVQPWISASAMVSLVAGMAWLYTVSSQEFELRSARSQLRLFVAGVVVLAGLSIIFYYAHSALSFWTNRRGFGPFPNKNQTADLFGVASVVLLACAQDDVRRGRKRWVLWVIGLGILVAGILLDLSRAGVLILVGGSALWILIVVLRGRSSARVALGISFLLLLATAILVTGGETFERFHLRGFEGSGMSSDFRWKIYHDAFDLIRQSPWCGVGLGNFEDVFALFRNESFNNSRALHPESDWLWVWVELGWPALVVAGFGAFSLFRRVFPLQEGTNQRFRLAALVGALIFAVHGLVDVNAHRVGSCMAGLFLAGLALHRPLCLKPSRVIAFLFRVIGLGLVVAGIAVTMSARSQKMMAGSVGVTSAKELAVIANRSLNFKEGIDVTTRALVWAPLDWQLYFTRALSEIGAKKPVEALQDFRRARFLEQTSFDVPFAEGEAWLPIRPVLAATAFREALRRAGTDRAEVYSKMLGAAALASPAVSQILEEVGFRESDLALTYLTRVNGVIFDRGVAELFKHDPELAQLNETKKLALFSLWSERGDPEKLAQAIQAHPDWLQFAWLGMAKYRAGKRDFEGAYRLTQQFGEAVALPRQSSGPSLAELQQKYVTNPDNYGIGYALYREQIQADRIDDALVTVRHFTERRNAPAYFHFLEAQGWAQKKNWERAWTAWLSYREAAAKR